DGVRKIEVDAPPARPDPSPFVAHFLRRAGCDVTRRQIAEARILTLEVVVAFLLRNVLRRTRIALLLRHPDSAVVAQRLRHQRKFRLILTALRNAGWMDLRVTRIREIRAVAIGPPDR